MNIMKYIAALLATMLPAIASGEENPLKDFNNDILIKSFFRDNGQNGVYLAASDDGIVFTPLNDDKPVMVPAPWEKQNLTRDPSIIFHEGAFHLVWTTGWRGDCFGYAKSMDLIHWSEPVRVQPFKGRQNPKNVWAPEICWDPYQKEFMIIWSSEIAPAGQRIFVTRTKDGENFSEAELFHERDYNVIDGHLLLDVPGKRWLLTYKNENSTNDGGKNIRIATTSEDFSRPFVDLLDEAIVGAGTAIQGENGEKSMGEGPSLVKMNDTYHIYWDSPFLKYYCLATSKDLKIWTDRTKELKVPSGMRHGTAFRAPRAAVGWLKIVSSTTPAAGK